MLYRNVNTINRNYSAISNYLNKVNNYAGAFAGQNNITNQRQYHITTSPQPKIHNQNNRFGKTFTNPSVLLCTPLIRHLSHDSNINLDFQTPLTSKFDEFNIPEAPSTIFELDPGPVIDLSSSSLSEAPLAKVATDSVTTLAEPAFSTIGLGGWSPIGIVQNCLEYLHVVQGIPWWGTIMIGTLVVRTLIFPLVILAHRNAAKMSNNMPQLQVLQLKMTQARQTGNPHEAARYGQEMVEFMKEKQLNPLKNLLVPLAQAPLFVSFFIGLRQMANTPVESLHTGGLFWFTDLTMPDQFYLLPLITSATLFLTIELGTDGGKLAAQNMQMMKYVLRAMPIMILPFTIHFPGAILCYWCCSNFISLIQVGVLKIPAVRDYFKIERTFAHITESLPIKPKGFAEGFKESWTNMKITKELEERKRVEQMQATQRASQETLKSNTDKKEHKT